MGSLLGFNSYRVDCRLIQGDTSGATEARLRQAFSRGSEELRPCVVVLDGVEALGTNRDGRADYRIMERLRVEVEKGKGN